MELHDKMIIKLKLPKNLFLLLCVAIIIYSLISLAFIYTFINGYYINAFDEIAIFIMLIWPCIYYILSIVIPHRIVVKNDLVYIRNLPRTYKKIPLYEVIEFSPCKQEITLKKIILQGCYSNDNLYKLVTVDEKCYYVNLKKTKDD